MSESNVAKQQYRVLSLDIFRGFCLLVIVCAHALLWYKLQAADSVPWFSFATAGFIILVGMMVGVRYLPGLRDAVSAKKIAKRLAYRTLQVFVIAQAFSIPFYIIFRNPGAAGHDSHDAVISVRGLVAILFCQRVNHRMAILFLIALWLFVSIGVIWARRLYSHWLAALMTGIVIYGGYLISGASANPQGGIVSSLPILKIALQWNLPFWGFCYFAGLAAGILLHAAMTKGNFRRFALIITLLALSGAVIWLISALAAYWSMSEDALSLVFRAHPYRLIFCASAAFLALGVFMLGEKHLDSMVSLKWLTVLGRHSLFAFVFQWCVVHMLSLFVEEYQIPSALRWVLVPLTVVIVYVGVYLESRWLVWRKAAKAIKTA